MSPNLEIKLNMAYPEASQYQCSSCFLSERQLLMFLPKKGSTQKILIKLLLVTDELHVLALEVKNGGHGPFQR